MAPLIAALVKAGLPALSSVLADKGKQWLEEKTGISLPDMSTSVLTADQIHQLKIQEIEHEEFLLEHALKIEQTKLDEKRMEFADVANARSMQVAALSSGDEFSRRFVYWLSAGCLVASGLYIAFITFGTIPEKNIRFADTTLGFILGTILGTILNFFFGTSRSSEKNGDTVRQVAKTLTEKGEVL